MSSVAEFRKSSKELMERYLELEAQIRNIDKYRAYLDKLAVPIEEEMKAIKAKLYTELTENELKNYADDHMMISAVNGWTKYSLADNVDASVREDLIEKGLITSKTSAGYCKVKVTDENMVKPVLSEEEENNLRVLTGMDL